MNLRFDLNFDHVGHFVPTSSILDFARINTRVHVSNLWNSQNLAGRADVVDVGVEFDVVKFPDNSWLRKSGGVAAKFEIFFFDYFLSRVEVDVGGDVDGGGDEDVDVECFDIFADFGLGCAEPVTLVFLSRLG